MHGQNPDDLLVALLEKGVDQLKQTDSMVAIRAEMSEDAVVELMQLFDQHGIEVFVDGGWGVDALLGQQTRSHGDLDVALQHKDVPKLRALLEARGYKDVPRNDTRDCNFVMGDDKVHEVDFHSSSRIYELTPFPRPRAARASLYTTGATSSALRSGPASMSKHSKLVRV